MFKVTQTENAKSQEIADDLGASEAALSLATGARVRVIKDKELGKLQKCH